MAREETRREVVRIALWGAALGMAGLPAFADAPAAANNTALYSADAIVTGTDMRQRPWGFAQCLKEVLVKVSGDPRLRNDPRVAALAGNADRYVASFDYADLMAHLKKNDDQGSYDRPHRLTVHFEPATIDALLAQLGDKPWRGKRPVIVPVLMVKGPKPPSYILSAETPRGDEQRGAFFEAASEFGISAHFPTEHELGAWVATIDNFAPKPPATDGSEAIVTGTLDWNEALPGWVGKWQTRWNGANRRWGISGVNYDAAFRDIVRGVVLLASGHGSPG
jgi:uncharacterized protein